MKIRLQIKETDAGAWNVHLHPSDRFNLDQDYTFDNKRAALEKGKDLLEQWLLELDDC